MAEVSKFLVVLERLDGTFIAISQSDKLRGYKAKRIFWFGDWYADCDESEKLRQAMLAIADKNQLDVNYID